MTISDLQRKAHETACAKGWYNQWRPPLELLMLAVTELAECAEVWRQPEFDKSAMAEELADCVIRIAGMAGYWSVDLEAAIKRKISINKARPERHGGKRY